MLGGLEGGGENPIGPRWSAPTLRAPCKTKTRTPLAAIHAYGDGSLAYTTMIQWGGYAKSFKNIAPGGGISATCLIRGEPGWKTIYASYGEIIENTKKKKGASLPFDIRLRPGMGHAFIAERTPLSEEDNTGAEDVLLPAPNGRYRRRNLAEESQPPSDASEPAPEKSQHSRSPCAIDLGEPGYEDSAMTNKSPPRKDGALCSPRNARRTPNILVLARHPLSTGEDA